MSDLLDEASGILFRHSFRRNSRVSVEPLETQVEDVGVEGRLILLLEGSHQRCLTCFL